VDPTQSSILKRIDSVPHWYHRIEIAPGIFTPGSCDPTTTLSLLDLPKDCKGLRVLDIGTRDGYFAFELERRGADVLAVDYCDAEDTGFSVAAELLNSKVVFRRENIYHLTVEQCGTFDMVLFLGVLYHLPDPMKALCNVRSLCSSLLYVETLAIDNGILLPDGRSVPLKTLSPQLCEIPLMQFYPGQVLNKDPSNYWGANLKCLEGMLGENKFQVLWHKENGNRAILKCQTVENEGLTYHNNIAYGLQYPPTRSR
jgi:tRNA (mo5U34)-methyltransferase